MQNKKFCCRIFPIILILLSTIIALGIWYFDDGIHEFTFLTNKGEIFNFIGTVLFISIIPVGIFYYLNDSERYQTKARLLSLLGFLPALVVFVYLLV
ncbi:MAG: hypothetical protein GQ525_12880 [Draconibacterium sp.]|nr:hypothetical protein [Draconibacterium sp.]